MLSDYGTMLTKWDKRELSGSDMIRDAEIIFDTIPTSKEEKMPFTSMFLLPIELWFTSVTCKLQLVKRIAAQLIWEYVAVFTCLLVSV